MAQKAITVSFDPSYHGVGRMFSDHKHLTNPQNHFLGLDGWTLTTQRAYRLPKAKKFCCLPLFSELRDFLTWRSRGPLEIYWTSRALSVSWICCSKSYIRIELVATTIFVILVSFWVVPAMRYGFIQYQAIIALFYWWLSRLASLGIRHTFKA